MQTLPEPSFIERDVAKATAECIALYEETVGKKLYPAQPERLFIDMIVSREMLIRIGIQEAAKQNLVRYAAFPMLDYLGELDACNRLAAQPARTTMQVTLSAAQQLDVLIDAGTRRGSSDGKYVFATDLPLVIPAGQTVGEVTAVSDTVGIDANGYLPGDINIEIDAVGWVQSIVNITASTGGADAEFDDAYRERIMLKPESYSSAGPELGYVYWAMSAHPSVIAVGAISPSAGVVNVYPLLSTGLPSQEILDLVEAALSDKKRRPLTDQLFVLLPTAVVFTIVAAVTLYDWAADDDIVQAAIVAALDAYTAKLRARLGGDLVVKQIENQIHNIYGVYDQAVSFPAINQVLTGNEWLNCTAVTVTIVGRVNG